MRGTFVLVVAAGVAAAVGWSMVRQAAEDPSPAATESLVAADPAPESQVVPPPLPSVPQRSEEPATEDPVTSAKAILEADPASLRDAACRSAALRVAETLLQNAESAGTRDGVAARILARRLYASVYACDASTRVERDLAYERSRALFVTLVKGNGAPAELVMRHRVDAGQSVWALAKGPWRQAGATVAPGFVLWINDVVDARRLRVGQTLKVPLEPLTVVVRKRAFEISVLLGGAPVERFSVAVGADAKTPVGVFQAKDCLKNPDWYMNGRRIAFGTQGHIIGTRWIGLTGAPEAEGIGIHGTNDDTSIGTAASLGCIRMKNAEIERIFEWIGPGTRVEIRD